MSGPVAIRVQDEVEAIVRTEIEPAFDQLLASLDGDYARAAPKSGACMRELPRTSSGAIGITWSAVKRRNMANLGFPFGVIRATAIQSILELAGGGSAWSAEPDQALGQLNP